ncbi:hypothetical protein TNCV_3770651 [Trichonephila clavipes]|nr:hypothetical protein TNCV_3770651 [Trichonephila clavipes]
MPKVIFFLRIVFLKENGISLDTSGDSFDEDNNDDFVLCIKRTFMLKKVPTSVFLLLQRRLMEVAGAVTPQGPREKNIHDLCKTECWSRWRNRLKKLTLDHTGERGDENSSTREPIVSRFCNLVLD